MNFNNDWTDISIKIKCEDLDFVSGIIHMFVPYGFYIEDYSDMEEMVPLISKIDLIDESLLSADKDIAIIHIYIESNNVNEAISFLIDKFKLENINYSIETSKIFEKDWENNWKTYYHPIEIGDNIVICPSWEKYDVKPNQIKVTLDPGMAFGTGTHETTKLCIKVLEKYYNGKDSMLDIGCGSGILSITASLLGISNIDGVDIDSMAIKISNENAILNNISNINFINCNLTDKINKKYDIITANIVADVIINLSSSICNFLNNNGIFICSGIIDQREDDVITALLNNRFNIIEKLYDNGWVCIVSTLVD